MALFSGSLWRVDVGAGRGRSCRLFLCPEGGHHLQNRPKALRGKEVFVIREGFRGGRETEKGEPPGHRGAVGAEPTPRGPGGDRSPRRAAWGRVPGSAFPPGGAQVSRLPPLAWSFQLCGFLIYLA